MQAFINATAGQATTVDIDVLSEMPDPCSLSKIVIEPDADQKPTWGDTCEFQIVSQDGQTVVKELGTVAVDPVNPTELLQQEYTQLTSGQKVRAIYTSVAQITGAKVAVNANAVS